MNRWHGPWLDEVNNGNNDAEEEQESGHTDVCPPEEGILAAEPCHGGDHDGLRALILEHGEVCSPHSQLTTSRVNRQGCSALRLTTI